MHSWHGGGVISTMMTMATTMAGERDYSGKDNNKYPYGKDNKDLIF